MRDSQLKKIPMNLVIGDNEINNNSVNYRLHGSKEAIEVKLDEYLDLLLKMIEEKK